jgi:hypothetical protein
MMKQNQRLLRGLLGLTILLTVAASTHGTLAQESGQNPTPIVISLTPATATPVSEATPTATPNNGLAPDRFEPNNDPALATAIGFQVETELTLIGDDVDTFTGYLKAGQILQVSTTVYDQLDTRLSLYWEGQLAAENDDRGPADVGSRVTFMAPADGWYVALISKATQFDGVYDLETGLIEPTATPTPSPTLTPSPTPTMMPSPTPLFRPDAAEPNDQAAGARPVTPGSRGRYTIGPGDEDFFSFIAKAGTAYSCETITDQVDTLLVIHAGGTVVGSNDDRGVGRVDSFFTWRAADEQTVIVQLAARGGSYGQYELVCQTVTPPDPPARPGGPPAITATPTATATLTATVPLTATDRISLTVRHLGRVEPQSDAPVTAVRLLVYYDANNDRAPGPGEGIPNVSMLAVDALGQRLAQVFTNAQGEATFRLHGQEAAAVARIIVPFVPAWSARIQAGEANNELVLGLPAVRLPVFFPIAPPATTETE